MKGWSAQDVSREAGAELVSPGRGSGGPERVTIDSRDAGPGALFVGLAGERVDGGQYVGQALAAGAWGVLARPQWIREASSARSGASGASTSQAAGALLASTGPLVSLQHLATAWRRELGAKVIGVTGSTGKTSTKELIVSLVSGHRRTVGSRANFNTEIGMPIEILGAPLGTEVIVLEMAMRAAGQIAELAAIARPDVGVIVSIGPAHLEQLESLEAIAAAKAELIDALPAGAVAITPVGEPLLAPHLRTDVRNLTFGEGGDVSLLSGDEGRVEIDLAGELIALEVDFQQAHMRRNLLAAVAAAAAVGLTPSGRVSLPQGAGRGGHFELAGGVTLIDDCYNANPMSMRAALDELAATVARRPGARSVAVLGDMLELGPAGHELHAEVGSYADAVGVELLVTVGPEASAIGERFGQEQHRTADAAEASRILIPLLLAGDVVLVKGSRGVRLEQVCEALRSDKTRPGDAPLNHGGAPLGGCAPSASLADGGRA
jgi:UDP-N-acetylmuramoyl-tripeptide--D-alanyl-D-alanine ligase